MGSLPEKIKQATWLAVGRRYLRGLNPGPLRAYARSVEPLLRDSGVDAVFSVNSWLLAYLETELPTAFWTDATFASMLGFYDSFTHLAPTSLRYGQIVEREVLRRCSLAVYSSNWAARSAVNDHGADPAKILILPFGANLDPMPARDTVLTSIDKKLSPANRATCQLLCIGVDWRRKGIDLAVETVAELTRRGIPAHLRVVGVQPPKGTVLPPNVEITGFLDKNSPAGQARLQQYYRESHFFILPSRAEAFGVVLSESCAHGVPCLTTDLGGLPDVIHDGVNGHRFPLDAPAAAYADWLAGLWRDPEQYRRSAFATLDDYHQRLCGQDAAARLAAALRALVDRRAAVPAA